MRALALVLLVACGSPDPPSPDGLVAPLVPDPERPEGAALHLEPEAAPAGERVVLRGLGLTPGTTIRVSFGQPGSPVHVGTTTVDRAGHATLDVRVPPETPPGRPYVFLVTGGGSEDVLVSVPFEVTESAADEPPTERP